MNYGLIGEKLGHSYSKEIHNQIGDYDYVLKEIPRDELSRFMTEKDFKGINVTIPYKQEVIPFLDYVDDAAKEIGAVNTIVNRDGKLFGYNTDFIGLRNLILSEKLDFEGKKVLILGTGGTSHTARAVSKSLNASEILIVSRTKHAESENVITYEEARTIHNDADFIINTTPCGMFPKIEESAINPEDFPKLKGVVDVIYNPLRTKLVVSAQNCGVKAKGGLFMLVSQAVSAAEFFFDKKIDKNVTERIYKNLLSKKQNIVLIGMPGSGKSTIGKELSHLLKRNFYDTDKMISEKEGKLPSEIIREKGEEFFRNLETDACRELSTITNAVIATGGGAILRPENVTLLKNNGIVFFIDRNIEEIRPTKSRPLSDSLEKLKAVYEKRYPIYTKSCDFKIESDENVTHTIKKIEDLIK